MIILGALGIAGLGAGVGIWEWDRLFGRRKWKHIVIHHSASFSGNASIFEAWHKKRGMRLGMAYHFVIGNGKGLDDGRIEIGSRWKQQLWGAHLRNWKSNLNSIGICLVGNFEIETCTDKQLRALKDLSSRLIDQYGISKVGVRGHKEMPGEKTLCPGRNFDMKCFRQSFA